MQLRQKEVILDGNGSKKLTVYEAGWGYEFRFVELEKELKPLLDDPNHNETFKFFLKNYYPLMASCSEGGVPSPQEAFALSSLYLDNWYLSFWELNEDIVGAPYQNKMDHEEVFFRDGSSLIVWQGERLPSFTLKLIELENKFIEHPLEDDPQGQLFCSIYYPKMAAACNGSDTIPEAHVVRNWPRSEITKWLDASRRMNPGWFVQPGEEQSEEAAREKRKKTRKRSGGSSKD